jgi:hypothetical protein
LRKNPPYQKRLVESGFELPKNGHTKAMALRRWELEMNAFRNPTDWHPPCLTILETHAARRRTGGVWPVDTLL